MVDILKLPKTRKGFLISGGLYFCVMYTYYGSIFAV